MSEKDVAVVVPLSNSETLSPDEEVSLRHLVHHLGHYDKFTVASDGRWDTHRGFGIKRFPRQFFGSAAAYGRLMLSPLFYESFREYRYVLIYHLDALALSDQLTAWCDKGYDYIGPPWVKCNDSPWVETSRVGNGGFSLRRVESFLRVLEAGGAPDAFARYAKRLGSRRGRVVSLMVPIANRVGLLNSASWHAKHWPQCNARGNEDYFWSDEAVRFYPDFRVAPFEEGLKFAFEVAPRLCLELNGGQLPFGCHAWPRYDRDFWEPYLLR